MNAEEPKSPGEGNRAHGFRQVGERLIHQGYVIGLVVGTFEGPDGATFDRDIIRHPGAVGIVAVDGEEVLLVRQYRPVLDAEVLEIPAGTMDKPGEDPRACAARELAEEAGVTAAEWRHLSSYYVAPGMSDEHFHLYLATGLTYGQSQAHGPEEEAMTLERFRLADTPALIATGRIADAKTIIGLTLARHIIED